MSLPYNRSLIKYRLRKYSRYNKVTGCLEWVSPLSSSGYPLIWVGYEKRGAHRVALELFYNEELKSRLDAMHLCDNPRCISTAKGHVLLGTRQENLKYANRRYWGRNQR